MKKRITKTTEMLKSEQIFHTLRAAQVAWFNGRHGENYTQKIALLKEAACLCYELATDLDKEAEFLQGWYEKFNDENLF